MKATKRKPSRAERIRRYITANPDTPINKIAEHFKTTYQIVYTVKRNMEGNAAKKPKEVKKQGKWVAVWKGVAAKKVEDKVTGLTPKQNSELAYAVTSSRSLNRMIKEAEDARKELSIEMIEPASDPVNHPAHYKVGGIETIDFIEAKGLNYRLGNVVKYITRADHKGERLENLKKAQWYLNREIEQESQAT